MSKKSTPSASSDNTTTSTSSNVQSTGSGSSYDINIQDNNQQNFNESVNRALDQTKDNINRSIAESQSQIPKYTSIVNSYQEQALQTAREISENFIESQKTIINSIQSAWRPYQQNFNNKVNACMSPEAATSAYSRFVSTFADNTVTALRTTNNLIFSSLDAYKTTLQHAKDTTKQIIDINTKTAQTLEQNTRQMTEAAQDAASRYNSSFNTNTNSSAGTTSTSSSASVA
jgi:hypothetical protein